MASTAAGNHRNEFQERAEYAALATESTEHLLKVINDTPTSRASSVAL
jgi:hypothetical protein